VSDEAQKLAELKRTVSSNATRISNLLRLRGGSLKPTGWAAEEVYSLLQRAADRPGDGVYRTLERIRADGARSDPRRANARHCLILLDKLWLVPAGSRAEQDVLRAYRESSVLIESEELRATVRDVLIEKQWSSFPVVRRTAATLR
jgi:hypothetical protein